VSEPSLSLRLPRRAVWLIAPLLVKLHAHLRTLHDLLDRIHACHYGGLRSALYELTPHMVYDAVCGIMPPGCGGWTGGTGAGSDFEVWGRSRHGH
jgi:hypothetical protein